MIQTWTIKSLLAWTTEDFKSRNIESPRLEGEILLSYLLKTDRLYLYTNFDRPLQKDELAEFKKLVSKRRQGFSTASIIGLKEFWSLEFIVNENVLIPRPDTETLVQGVLDSGRQPQRVLDLCTGTGCIAIALATEFLETEFDVTDISIKALEVAAKNIDKHNVANRVFTHQGDLFKALNNDVKYDIIVANPPYVKGSIIDTLSDEVINEPRVALEGGGEKGLDIIIRILKDVDKYLTSDGLLFVELDDSQADDVANNYGPEYLNKQGSIIKDLSGKKRIVKF